MKERKREKVERRKKKTVKKSSNMKGRIKRMENQKF